MPKSIKLYSTLPDLLLVKTLANGYRVARVYRVWPTGGAASSTKRTRSAYLFPMKRIGLGELAISARKDVRIHLRAVVCGFDKLQWHLPTTGKADHFRSDHAGRSLCKHRNPPSPMCFNASATVSEKQKLGNAPCHLFGGDFLKRLYAP